MEIKLTQELNVYIVVNDTLQGKHRIEAIGRNGMDYVKIKTERLLKKIRGGQNGKIK